MCVGRRTLHLVRVHVAIFEDVVEGSVGATRLGQCLGESLGESLGLSPGLRSSLSLSLNLRLSLNLNLYLCLRHARLPRAWLPRRAIRSRARVVLGPRRG